MHRRVAKLFLLPFFALVGRVAVLRLPVFVRSRVQLQRT